MKKRNFYPAQVLRRLHNKTLDQLTPSERLAAAFAFRRGRRQGVCVGVLEGRVFALPPAAVGRAVLADLRRHIGLPTGPVAQAPLSQFRVLPIHG